LKPRGILILKTYDPVSGTCLKYRTNKASEIGRLVSGLQRCARVMAAMPPQDESSELAEAAKEEAAPEQAKAAPAAAASGGGGSGGKKKKKGKK
jgi:Signal recognition particle 9 kDa protein (SRP9)